MNYKDAAIKPRAAVRQGLHPKPESNVSERLAQSNRPNECAAFPSSTPVFCRRVVFFPRFDLSPFRHNWFPRYLFSGATCVRAPITGVEDWAFLFTVAPVEGISMDETRKSVISLLETWHVPIDGVGRVADDEEMAVIVFPSEEDRGEHTRS
jgi:hypothetical protein